jgi:dTDP-4-dehydrorhamnose reductase
MKLLVLVVGAGGQLGEAMAGQLSVKHTTVPVTRSELDVANPDAVFSVVSDVMPDVIINCSAYTNVDAAEDDPVAALRVNAMAVRTLARAAARIDATLVHYSTDFVFDGVTDRPYSELDAPNPRGTYAMSKLLGEWFAAEAPRHYVLRVESLFGGARARSSVDRILENLRAQKPVRAFVDRTVSPSFVEDVVTATSELLRLQAPTGRYHCVNSGWTNWAGLSRELARLIERPDADIEEITMSAAGLKAPRPLFAALSNQKLIDAGVAMPSWQDALARYVSEPA